MIEELKSILDAATGKMDRALTFFQEELLSIRAGKATPNVLSSVTVDYYGSQVPVSQVASVTIPDARTILIQPWEKKLIPVIEKAILVANIGLTPSNNGEHIRLSIPPLTEERRTQLVKQARGEAETARVSLRNARRDAVEGFKKAHKDGMPEDMAKDGEAEAQKLIDRYTKKLDDVLAEKEHEIMTV
jgi:ribosome recycling factor